MNGRQFEFRISQYADGTLPAAQRESLESHIANDPRAQRTLAEYRRLQEHLDRSLALPPIKWNALADHLSAVVAANSQTAPMGRIGVSAKAWRRRLSIAASMAIAAGAALWAVHPSTPAAGPIVAGPIVAAAKPHSIIIGPQPEVARRPAVEQITIGPSPVLAQQGGSWRYADGIVSAPSRVQIFSKATPATSAMPDGESHLH